MLAVLEDVKAIRKLLTGGPLHDLMADMSGRTPSLMWVWVQPVMQEASQCAPPDATPDKVSTAGRLFSEEPQLPEPTMGSALFCAGRDEAEQAEHFFIGDGHGAAEPIDSPPMVPGERPD